MVVSGLRRIIIALADHNLVYFKGFDFSVGLKYDFMLCRVYMYVYVSAYWHVVCIKLYGNQNYTLVWFILILRLSEWLVHSLMLFCCL